MKNRVLVGIGVFVAMVLMCLHSIVFTIGIFFLILITLHETKACRREAYPLLLLCAGSLLAINFFWQPWLCLVIILDCSINDSLAYFGGTIWTKVLKRTSAPLAPTISPNKTVIGFACGLLGGVVCFPLLIYLGQYIFPPYQIPFTFTTALDFIIPAFCCNILAPQGDLLFSSFKRKLKIKDYSNLLGGHGGITDRLASWTLVAPFMLVFLSCYNHGYQLPTILIILGCFVNLESGSNIWLIINHNLIKRQQ